MKNLAALAQLKRVFPNKHALYERIDTLLAHGSVLRVGIVPLASSRSDIKRVLESLIEDPLNDSDWFPTFRARALTKDVIVSQSSSFDYIETRNSALEYPVPFTGPPIEYVEVSNPQDSREHLAKCALILYASTNPAEALRTPIATVHPHLLVLDSLRLLQASSDAPSNSNEVVISTELAAQGNELLRESPKNITPYLDLYRKSNVATLKQRFDPTKVRVQLLDSVFKTCDGLVAADGPDPAINREVSELRTAWADSAHRELQGRLIPALEKLLYTNLAWYKLYARTDDVEATTVAVLNQAQLPQSNRELEYIIGRVDKAVTTIPSNEKPSQSPISTANVLSAAAAVKLQNSALKAVLTALSVQIPISLCAVGGWYFAECTAYSMGALAGLGLVVGLQRLQKMWLKAAKNYEKTVIDLTRTSITETETQIWDMYEERVARRQQELATQEHALAEVKKEVYDQN